MTPPPTEIELAGVAAQGRRMRSAIEQAIGKVLDHGQYVMGPEVGELERRLAERTGATHVVTCSSGTDALVLALLALGVGRGDAVIVPALTFAATAEAVALLGATPVFADVLPGTCTVDPASVAAIIDTWRGPEQLRTVISVDLYGQPADYDLLEPLCAARGLALVADGAQSFGAIWAGRPVGTLGAVTTTSFFPSKPLGCYGDGGAVFVSDDQLAAALRSLRVHGQGRHKYDNARVGLNGRLDTLQAAILLVKLDALDDELSARRDVAGRYTSALAGLDVVPPHVDPRASSAWAQYTVQLEDRDRAAAEFGAQGIPTAVYYPVPLHHQTAYAGLPASPTGLPVAEALCASVLSLPMHPYLSETDQSRVLDALDHALARRPALSGAQPVSSPQQLRDAFRKDGRVKVAQVGLGYWGPKLLRNLVRELGERNVVAIDHDESRLRAVRRDFAGIDVRTDLTEALEDDDIVAVAISTPLQTHASLTWMSLCAGRHVMVEKPLADSAAEAAKLALLAEREGLVLMAGHTFLFSPRVEFIQRCIQDGRLGPIHYVMSDRLNLGLHRRDANVIWDLAPHDFSILFYILGESPETVQTTARATGSDLPEVAFMSLTFPSGAIASVNVSWLAPLKVRRTVIIGSGRMILYDDTVTDESIKVYDKGIIEPESPSFAENQMTYRFGDTVSPHISPAEPLAVQVQHFLRAIATGEPCRSDGWVGVRVVEALEAAQRSWELGGRPVPVKRLVVQREPELAVSGPAMRTLEAR